MLHRIERYDRESAHRARRWLLLALIVASLVSSSEPTLAHGGEDHGAANVPAATTPMAAGSALSTSGSTEIFELVLKYPVPEVGEDTRLRLFLADFATNAPIEGATMSFAIKPAGVEVKGAPTMVSPGVYDLVARFPGDGIYSLVATVKAAGRTDFVEVTNIYAGEAAETFLAEHSPATDSPVSAAEESSWWQIPLIAIGVAAVGAIVFLVVRGRSHRKPNTSI